MKRTPPLPIMIALWAAVATIGLAALVVWLQTADKPNGDASMITPDVKIGGPFQLTNQHAKRVSEADFSGQYMMIYFGYTYCPDICPTTLSIMTSALTQLADKNPALAAKITPIFITVDPLRDTVDVMAEYVNHFHDRMVGLTGSVDDIKAVVKAYRTFYSLGEPDEDGDYLVDHSSFLYLMGPEGAYRTIFKQGASPLQIAKTLKTVLESDENE